LPDHTSTSTDGPSALGYAAVALSWLIPGSGHLLIGQRGRGWLFLITIHLLFGGGLLIGGIHAMNPPEQPIWSYTQLLAGWPTLLANTIARRQTETEAEMRSQLSNNYQLTMVERNAMTRQLNTMYAPQIQDVGTVYCGLAGMLNLLLVFDVLVRISSPAREDAP